MAMLRSIRWLLDSPAFADDDETTRRAAVLYTLLVAILAGLGAIAFFSVILPSVSPGHLIAVGPLLLITLALLVALRRGHVRLASLALSLSFWAAVTAACVL